MMYKYTTRAKKAMEIANDIATKYGHKYLGTEHILYGLLKEGNGVGAKVLKNLELKPEDIEEKILELLGNNDNVYEIEYNESKKEKGINNKKKEEKVEKKSGKIFEKNTNTKGKGVKKERINGLTPNTKKVLENALVETQKIGYDYIGTEQILIGIVRNGENFAIKILSELDINTNKLYTEIIKVIQESDDLKEYKVEKEKSDTTSTYKEIETLNQYGEDLTQKAIENKVDPVIGRNLEIDRVIQILSRRTKNNPCLIGEPGVGKTAIIEGLAQKIVNGEVPENLKEKVIVTLDISSMVAGAKYRGDFEERIKKVLDEIKEAKDIIIFIDEIHTIVGAGAAEGAIDAANILKPLLARGEIQLVGATTINEYRKYIEKDSALERRFSPIIVNEPSKEDTISILKGIREKYENYHNVIISDEAIECAVEMSVRYITDRFLPDKAIDLIDEASAKARLKIYKKPQYFKKIEEKLEKIKNEKEKAIDKQEYEKAAEIRDKEDKIKYEYKEKYDKWEKNKEKIKSKIQNENIAEIIAEWTKINVEKINEKENIKLKELEKNLQKRVIGQEYAVESISKAIRRGRVGLNNGKRPIGSFLFLGPTGVGKTELCKALAENLFGKEDDLIKIDMSEYMESHSVSKLIGSPPGYVGFNESGQLTEKIRRRPYSIILFDEIEKAHIDVMNILLQILEDGKLTDSQGKEVNFKNTIIIMTSNIGAKLITNKNNLGFCVNSRNEMNEKQIKIDNEDVENSEIKIENKKIQKEVMGELKKELKPELINRIDEIIVFNKLEDKHLLEIIDIMLNDIVKRLEIKDIKINITEDVKKQILEQTTELGYGARPLRRTIQKTIENMLADKIIELDIEKNLDISIYVEEKEIKIKN